MKTITQDRESEKIEGYEPTLRDLIALEMPEQATVSPTGAYVAFTLRTTNWRDNRYEQRGMLLDVHSGELHALTRSGSVQQIEWVDAHTLALLRSGPEEDAKAQIWLYEDLVGEGWAVTDHDTGVDWFKPFAAGFLFRAEHPERAQNKKRSARFGDYTRVEQEKSASALYYIGLEERKAFLSEQRALTEEEGEQLVSPVIELSKLLPEPLSIQTVAISAQNDAIYLTCWPHDDLVYYRATTCFCLTLDAPAALAAYLERERNVATEQAGDRDDPAAEAPDDSSALGEITQLHVPAGASIAAVAPDGAKLLIAHRGRDNMMYTREDYWMIETATARAAGDAEAFLAGMTNISAGLDRQILEARWGAAGIVGVYADGTALRLVQLEEDGRFFPLEMDGIYPESLFHLNERGQISFAGCNATTAFELYLLNREEPGWSTPVQLTDFGSDLADWKLGTIETIRWTSFDGTEIEGVLRKPPNFDPDRRYPLVFVVHGGPDWLSPAYLLYGDDVAYYPTVQFANKDILVLKPNYRGSMGRGQAFSELNVDNLGVGDLWDLESAIDHLVELGWVDPDRVGCMGWSQGGYISAFAGLHSRKFKAVSVGAGVSDWYTYHISNDIPDFTKDYLSGSPFRERDLYAKTAPISKLADAVTPMLIQHGKGDRRVPLSNAMELYRGLQEMDVPVALFVYPDFGHGITRPRENHAVMHQNLTWFSHYLLGEALNLE
jgi:dipeptidyl aminopeptidase/acylaminoacyl peptidase